VTVRWQSPKRVLFIDHTAMMGGGEIALLNLIRHLDLNLFSPIVLLFADGPLAEALRTEFEVHIIPLRAGIVKAKKDTLGARSLLRIGDVFRVFGFAFRISRFIAEHHIDLVHTNSLKADIIGGMAARLARRAVVWHVRDRIAADYLPQSVTWLFRKLAAIIPNHVIANSEATMQTLHLRKGFSTTVPSGVDLQRSSVIHDGTPATRRVTPGNSPVVKLGLLGRISPWKGQHVFLKAAAMVHREMPTVRFSIIGAALFDEADYENKMRHLAAELGLQGVVEFTGFCANVTEQIEQLDVVVHASTMGEPFGQVIIEGMAAAKPVIATNGGGVPEIVVDGETGILVPMGDVSALANAMQWMIHHPAEAAQMGNRGRMRVLESFTVQKSTAKVEAIFTQLLNRG
jgi:glycosyltransferase involved in cell wall biosynthesis